MSESRIIVTADLDFPRLLAILSATGPGLILLRGGNYNERESVECIERVLRAVSHGDLPKSVVVVDRERIAAGGCRSACLNRSSRLTVDAQSAKIERRTDMYVSTLADFVRAMGGDLEIRAVFPDGVVSISQFAVIDRDAV